MTKPRSAPAPGADLDDNGELEPSAARAFREFLATMPAETDVRVTLYRLPHTYTPTVSSRESLPPPPFQADMAAMQEEIRARYGPGKYQLYVKYKDQQGKPHITSPSFVLAPDPALDGGRELFPPEPPADPLADAMAQLGDAAKAKADAAKLAALQGLLTDAPAQPTRQDSIAETVKLIAAIKELFAPAPVSGMAGMVENLTVLEKVTDIVSRIGGGGGNAAPAGRTTGWDVAVEFLRQMGPHAGEVFGLFMQAVLAKAGTLPGAPVVRPAGVPTGPTLAAPSTAPAVAAAPESNPVLQATDGDPAKAARLQWFLDTCLMEMGQPPDTWNPDSWDRADELAETHLPGFRGQLVALGEEEAWQTWMRMDPRVMNIPAARPWVTGLVAFLRQPPDQGGDQ